MYALRICRALLDFTKMRKGLTNITDYTKISQPASHKVRMFSAIACFGVAALFVFYINTQVLMYSDDYLYSLFFRDGFSGFLEWQIWHYQNFNGRVFVHVLAQITFVFNNYVFSLVNLGFPILIGYFTYKTQNNGENQNKFDLVFHMAFFLALLMLLDVSILRESYLWASASFNYTLGTVMVALLCWVCKDYVKSQKIKWHMIVIAFLSGASTEQMGLTALFILGLVLLFCKNQDNLSIRLKNLSPILISCALGLLSIFLSRATRFRLGRENALASFDMIEIFETILQRFERLATIAAESNFLIILSLFGILIGLLPLVDKNLTNKFKLGFLYSFAMLAINFMPITLLHILTLIVTIVFLFYVGFVFLSRKDFIFSSFIILAALFSAAIMMFTSSQEPRVAFPFILLIMAVCASLIVKLKIAHHIIAPIFVVIACVVFLPVILGYQYNRGIMNENIKRISEANETGGAVYFNIDFMHTHRFVMVHETGGLEHYFRQYHRINADSQIFFYSYIHPAITTRNGHRLQIPVVYVNGQVTMPVELVVRALGGQTNWIPRDRQSGIDGYVEFFLYGKERKLNTYTNIINYTKDNQVHKTKIIPPFIGLYPYWYAEDIYRVFGIAHEFDVDRYVYVIFKNHQ